MTIDKNNWGWITTIKLWLAGWHRCRDVWQTLQLPISFSVFPVAKQVLSEFGGLRFGHERDLIELDPRFGKEVAEEIRLLEQKIKNKLYPIGRMEHQDREYLLIDETGIVYWLSIYHVPAQLRIESGPVSNCTLYPLASSFTNTIVSLVNLLARAEYIKKDLDTIGLRGVTWQVE